MDTPVAETSSRNLQSDLTLPFELNPQSASDWLVSLPIDKNQTWKLVYSVIRLLNKHELAGDLRLDILEILRPVSFVISNKLQSNFSVDGFPVDEKRRKIAKLSVRLHSELSAGYRKLIDSDSFGSEFKETLQAKIIHRALQSTSLSLLRTCQMGEPFPPGIFGEIYGLFKKAESKDLQWFETAENQWPFASKSSIESVFKRTILFAFINPHRFNKPEIQSVFRFLEKNSNDLQMSLAREDNGRYALICVDLDSNSHPSRVSSAIHRNSHRYLFTGDVDLTLNQANRQESIDLEPIKSKLIPYFKDFSTLTLSGERERKQFVQDFIPIFSYLRTSKSPFGTKHEKKANLQDWVKIPDFDLVPLDDGSNNAGLNSSSQCLARSTIDSSTSGNLSRKTDGIGIFDCYCAPLNLKGFYLIETDTELRIRELFAFWASDTPVQIGIIHRERANAKHNQFQYWIEILGSHVTPVSVQLGNTQTAKALLLNQTGENSTVSSILLAPRKLRRGTKLTVGEESKNRVYEIRNLKAFNSSFCWYTVKLSTKLKPV